MKQKRILSLALILFLTATGINISTANVKAAEVKTTETQYSLNKEIKAWHVEVISYVRTVEKVNNSTNGNWVHDSSSPTETFYKTINVRNGFELTNKTTSYSDSWIHSYGEQRRYKYVTYNYKVW